MEKLHHVAWGDDADDVSTAERSVTIGKVREIMNNNTSELRNMPDEIWCVLCLKLVTSCRSRPYRSLSVEDNACTELKNGKLS